MTGPICVFAAVEVRQGKGGGGKRGENEAVSPQAHKCHILLLIAAHLCFNWIGLPVTGEPSYLFLRKMKLFFLFCSCL